MFATILGPYPHPVGLDAEAALRLALEDQLEADLGLLADGRVLAPGDDAVASWRAAVTCGERLASERGLEPRPVKARVIGPYTLGRLGDRAIAARRRRTLAAAEAGNAVLRTLLEAGAPVVQVEEDALRHIGPDDGAERDLAVAALRRLTADLTGHLSLSVAGGDPCGAGARVLYDAPFSSHLFDLILGPEGWRVAREAPAERGLVVGVADCRTTDPDDAGVSAWAAYYAASLRGRGLERIALAPSAGLESLPREVAVGKLAALAVAAAMSGRGGPGPA
jgi:methionine synthase II (cobalamin-independent)